jgi:hypothetical protein
MAEPSREGFSVDPYVLYVSLVNIGFQPNRVVQKDLMIA